MAIAKELVPVSENHTGLSNIAGLRITPEGTILMHSATSAAIAKEGVVTHRLNRSELSGSITAMSFIEDTLVLGTFRGEIINAGIGDESSIPPFEIQIGRAVGAINAEKFPQVLYSRRNTLVVDTINKASKELKHKDPEYAQPIVSIIYDQDGKIITLGRNNRSEGTLSIWDLNQTEPNTSNFNSPDITRFDYSDSVLVIGTTQRYIQYLDLRSGKPRTPQTIDTAPNTSAVAVNRETFAIASETGEVQIFALKEEGGVETTAKFTVETGAISTVAILPTEQNPLLAITSGDNFEIRTLTGEILSKFDEKLPGRIKQIATAPVEGVGYRVVIGDDNGNVVELNYDVVNNELKILNNYFSTPVA